MLHNNNELDNAVAAYQPTTHLITQSTKTIRYGLFFGYNYEKNRQVVALHPISIQSYLMRRKTFSKSFLVSINRCMCFLNSICVDKKRLSERWLKFKSISLVFSNRDNLHKQQFLC